MPPTAQQPGKPSPPSRAAPTEDTFAVPPIAREEASEGPDVSAEPGAEVGHYGMGYGDPTRHQGGRKPETATPSPARVRDPAAPGVTDGPPPPTGGQQ